MINKISKEEICKFEKNNNLILPDVYKEFLLKYNGYSFEGGLLIYGLEEITETNDYLEVKKYYPQFIAIGDDGGDLVFLMKQDRASKEVYFIEQGDCDIEDCYGHIENFNDWFLSGCEIKSILQEDEFNDDNVEVFLIAQPKCGLKDLVKIKNIFNMTISSGKLLSESKNTPFKIVSNITRAKAEILINKVGQSEIFMIKKH